MRLVMLMAILAHFTMADVSELVKSGNGFLYDAPVNSNLPLAPLDLANDARTLKAFSDKKPAKKSKFEITITPSLATSASLKQSVTAPAPKTILNYFSRMHSTSSPSMSYHSSAVSGYNYAAPMKPFFLN